MLETALSVQALLFLYVLIVLFNVVVTFVLFKMSGHRLFKPVLIAWLGGLVNFFAQAIFDQFDWKMYIGFCTAMIVSWSYLSFMETLFEKKRYHHGFIFLASLASCLLGLILLFVGVSYQAAAWFAAIGVVIPGAFAIHMLYVEGKKRGAGYKLLFLLTLLHCIHFLDYPLLRSSELGSLIGFSIALGLVFIFSTFLPGFILVEISRESERKLQQKVEEQTRDLAETLEQKRLLVNILSHDLATPLTVVGFHFSLLEQEHPHLLGLPTTQRAKKSYDSILEMLHKAKQLQKYGFDRGGLEDQVFDVFDVLKDIEAQLKELLEAKNLSFEIKSGAVEGLKLRGDRKVFRNQVLLNLVSNAIKFSYPNGKIIIEVLRDESQVILKIVDFGIGIPANFREQLFELNKVKVREGTLKEGGTGLGLFTAFRCLQLMGGELKVSSSFLELDQQNRTEFILTLPLANF
ncbi:MAG: sensor histidine kinase [Bdellovibrionia bacterium]